MPLRDARTPEAPELDRLAEITAADEARALRVWDQRSRLPGLLDATRDDRAGDASGPLPDDAS